MKDWIKVYMEYQTREVYVRFDTITIVGIKNDTSGYCVTLGNEEEGFFIPADNERHAENILNEILADGVVCEF